MWRLLGGCAAVLAAAAWGLLSIGPVAAEEGLIFANSMPPNIHLNVKMLTPWAETVNAQGLGVLRLDIRHGPPLVSALSFYDRVLNDVVQITFGSLHVIAGKFVRTLVVQLPLTSENAEEGSVAFWRLYKSGLVDSEFDEVIPLYLCLFPQQGVHLVKAPSTLDNLNGLKLAVNSKVLGDIAEELGGTPISLATSNVYMALQRGTVNGLLGQWTTFQPYRFGEVTTYHIETGLGVGTGAVLMARKKYDALPVAARQIIDANSGEGFSRRLGAFWDQISQEGRQDVMAMPGHHIVSLSPAQTEAWRRATAAVLDEWVKDTPGGEKVLAGYRHIYMQVKSGS